MAQPVVYELSDLVLSLLIISELVRGGGRVSGAALGSWEPSLGVGCSSIYSQARRSANFLLLTVSGKSNRRERKGHGDDNWQAKGGGGSRMIGRG